MIRSRVLRRRLVAALLLYGFAVLSAFYWNDWQLDLRTLGINCASATAGLVYLHVRWRERERRALTPAKVKDIFS